MTRIYITRHGQTEWNLEMRLQGWKDAPLTELGVKQAEALGERLRELDIDYVYLSPLGRTKRTAEIALDGKKIPIFEDERLKEINMGKWEGMKADKVKDLQPVDYEMFWNSPDKYEPESGESFYDVKERVIEALKEIQEKHPEGNILIITHGCAGKIILSHFEDRPLADLWDPPKIRETSLSVIEVDEGGNKIVMYGDTTHLDDLELDES